MKLTLVVNYSKMSSQSKLDQLLGRLSLDVFESTPSSRPDLTSNEAGKILLSTVNGTGGIDSQSANQQRDSGRAEQSSLTNGVHFHAPPNPRKGPQVNGNTAPKKNAKTPSKMNYPNTNGMNGKVVNGESNGNALVPMSSQNSSVVVAHNNNPVGTAVSVKEEVEKSAENNTAPVGSPLDLLMKFKAERDAEAQLQVQELEKLRQKEALVAAASNSFSRKNVPRKILEQMRLLPIYSSKNELVELIKKNQMVIVIGETGSGKSTQIPQYLVEAGFAAKGKVGITQPRRVAAKALAERVAIECGVKVGTRVGYAVRFDKCVSGNTVIKYMTDGMLVKEFSQEPFLDTYSVIIIDEAHERSIHTDICFGLLKRAALNRPDLKIIISSATLNAPKFSKYFNDAPILNVSGKGYEVELIYELSQFGDYIQRSVETVFKIHRNEPRGDVLVFLAGQDEIEKVWDLIESGIAVRGISPADLLIVPCCGALPFEEQQKMFEETPAGVRKVVLATNIAETSVTIDGIVYVVDCGHFKQNQYNPKTGIDSLLKLKITKFQAIQRAGRAGRTRAGKCYRLYTQLEFLEFKQAAIPEIQRGNVESVVLDLLAMGITNILNFDFIDSPSIEALMGALEHLQWLSALDEQLAVTHLGIRMSKFPLDPPLAKVLMESARLECSAEVLTIVSLLSTQYQNIFSRAKKKRVLSDSKKALFNQPEGDHFSLLKVYTEWTRNYYREDWCRDNFVQFRILCEAYEVRQELRDILISHGLPEVSCGTRKECIQKAFTAGYFRRVARKKPLGHAYETLTLNSILNREDLFLHPSSALFHIKPHPQWVIFHEVKKTSKAFITGAIVINHEWIKEYAPEFAKKLTNTYGIIF
ncbi:unnamed protein product [Orchesella dallaii]|uniref:RNA helicase n=1 Tax=Orchesella dallaii TaxID=48710 RepID=A0ABP1QNH4_9HEXA